MTSNILGVRYRTTACQQCLLTDKGRVEHRERPKALEGAEALEKVKALGRAKT